MTLRSRASNTAAVFLCFKVVVCCHATAQLGALPVRQTEETMLSYSYRSIKSSIVAFTMKYARIRDPQEPVPLYPPIIGTGFVVRENGLIATNAHVVRAFKGVARPPGTAAEDWGVHARIFRYTHQGLLDIPLDVLSAFLLGGFKAGPEYYGPRSGPDIAYVQVRASGLPAVSIDPETEVFEGMQVGTAGFPMGVDALTAPGWLHQLTPTLQTGIVSAVLPYACTTPHAYSINVTTQGGASGSPVFLPDSGKVIGILYAGLNDVGVTKRNDVYKIPTSISYVVPSHYIGSTLDAVSSLEAFRLPDGTPTLDAIVEHATITNVVTGDVVEKRVDSQFERHRLEGLARRTPDDLDR